MPFVQNKGQLDDPNALFYSNTFAGRAYGFELAAYDRSKELVIDPLITGIFQGTADTATRPTCMASDSQGNIYAAEYSANQL